MRAMKRRKKLMKAMMSEEELIGAMKMRRGELIVLQCSVIGDGEKELMGESWLPKIREEWELTQGQEWGR